MPALLPASVRAALHPAVSAALAVVPLVLVTVALLPAITVLPLLPGGQQRAGALIGQLHAWSRTVLRESRGRGGS
jgi:hypothetical protein